MSGWDINQEIVIMLETTGDMFQIDCDAVCVTTNGYVKANGENVMGRGCAAQVAKQMPDVPKILGSLITTQGNHVHYLNQSNGVALLSFPVKPVTIKYNLYLDVVKHMQDKFNKGDIVPGWAATADIEIIEQSAKELVAYVDSTKWQRVLLPRPGCGAGELEWEIVKPILDKYLDDRFLSITF